VFYNSAGHIASVQCVKKRFSHALAESPVRAPPTPSGLTIRSLRSTKEDKGQGDKVTSAEFRDAQRR
jgi:hypothetical protein